jgi:hypothetical protein
MQQLLLPLQCYANTHITARTQCATVLCAAADKEKLALLVKMPRVAAAAAMNC